MGFLDKLFGKKEEPKMELAAPLAGEAVSISQVNDPTFSDEILGHMAKVTCFSAALSGKTKYRRIRQ